MAEFYRRTKIEELGATRPGLLDWIETVMRDRTPYAQAVEAMVEQWGEEARVSATVWSNHWILRVWKRKDAELRSYTEQLGKGKALLELQKQNPTAERGELIDALLDIGIVTQQNALMEKDPLKLLVEQRRRQESAGNYELEKARLDLDRERLGNEKKELELKVAKFQTDLAEVTDEAESKIRKGESLTVDDINRIRERFGFAPAAAGA